MRMELLVLVMLLSVSGIAYAFDCAASAYVNSCNKCNFSAAGKMDEVCYNSYQAQGKKCIANKRPYLAYRYNEGTCPEVDACAQELQTCKNAASIGSDKQDCLNPFVGTCFTEADTCVANAEKKCSSDVIADIDSFFEYCPFSIFMILLLIAGFVYSRVDS
jgi:hypothetical protein